MANDIKGFTIEMEDTVDETCIVQYVKEDLILEFHSCPGIYCNECSDEVCTLCK